MERFPESVATHAEARAYYRNRAVQLLIYGWKLKRLTDLPFGVEAELMCPKGVWHKSVFILEGHTGQGHLTRWFETLDIDGIEFVTSSMCPKMRGWLDRRGMGYAIIELTDDKHYHRIAKYYGDRKASRSGLFYMNHIDEGLYILNQLDAPTTVRQAWCLHPLVQGDEDLCTAIGDEWLWALSPVAIALAMEYRQRANAHLSFHPPKTPILGPLEEEMRLLLYADKVQNRKDFEAHLRGQPEVSNSDRLDAYFQEWFEVLGITEAHYGQLVNEIATQSKQPLRARRDGPLFRAQLL